MPSLMLRPPAVFATAAVLLLSLLPQPLLLPSTPASPRAWLTTAAQAAETPSNPLEAGQELLQGGDGEAEGSGEGDGDGGEAGAEESEAEKEPSVLDVDLPDFEGGPLSASAWRRYLKDVGKAFADKLPELTVALFKALLVLIAFWILYRLVASFIQGFVRRTNADPTVGAIVGRLVKYVVVAFALIMAASQLGFNVGSVLAGVGILGLALGLAAQESLSNLVAGLTILFDRPYRVGDNVTIADSFGKVQQIGLRTTRILTVERLDTILPNREIVNQTIVNHTANPHLRLGIPFSIAYKEDSRQAREALLKAVAGKKHIHEEPAPEVVVTRLADSGVEMELRVWLRDPHREREATVEFVEVAKIALDEAGIEIPFPQRTLHWAKGSGGFPGASDEGSGEAGGETEVDDPGEAGG